MTKQRSRVRTKSVYVEIAPRIFSKAECLSIIVDSFLFINPLPPALLGYPSQRNQPYKTYSMTFSRHQTNSRKYDTYETDRYEIFLKKAEDLFPSDTDEV